MAEIERDPKLSQRYRELGAEEPPRAIDEAILAASRRAAEVHPAPLVVPTGRRRWYFPLAAAAVIVLSVAVTWHVQRAPQPDPDGVALYEPKPFQGDEAADRPAQAAPAPAAKPARRDQQQDGKRERVESRPAPAAPARALAPSAESGEKAAAAASVLPAEEPAPAEGIQAQPREAQAQSRLRAVPAAPAPAAKPAPEALGGVAAAAVASPEKQLERIAELRQAGKHDEADKLLAEFRKRHPDYRISEEMLGKVEKR